MNSATNRAQTIFLNALEISSPDVRIAYLDAECKEDEALRHEVDGLIDHANRMEGFLEGAERPFSEYDVTAIPTPTVQLESEIGPFKIREKIGEGGMGEVYIAEQSKPVRRKVALKVIKPGMASKDIIARFEAERQALAMMNHPNIAKVLDGGTTSDGRPYFVMELVRGVPITEYCDQKRLTTRERLELFIKVCQAVQHAHLKGIIHRDLKPSNVLVEQHDVEAVPKVIDFGIAKATNQQLTQQTIYTQMSQLIGTPLYMSPEQAELSGLDIDTRSDIYSLGVLLYEILTGTTPFDASKLSSVGLDEMRRIIREEDPPRPSFKVSTLDHDQLSTISIKRQVQPRELSLSMKRELDWIVMKALEKDRERRYESANAFAADIQRYLSDEPVGACPPTVSYRLKKYAMKHKVWLTTAALLMVMLVSSTAVSGVFAYQANEAKEDAEIEKENAVAAQQQSDRNLTSALDAVEKLLEHTSNPELQQIPLVQPILRDILSDTIEFYNEFEITTDSSLVVRSKAIDTRLRLADLSNMLGDSESSIRQYQQAIRELRDLEIQNPHETAYRIRRAQALTSQGWVYHHGTHEFAKASESFSEGIRLLEELPDGPKDEARNRLIGVALKGLSTSQQYLGENQKSLANLKRAYEQFGVGGMDFANLIADNDPDLAEKIYLQEVERHRAALAAEDLRGDRTLPVSELILASGFFRTRNKKLSQDLITIALDHAKRLAGEYPDVNSSKTLLQRSTQGKLGFLLEEEPGPERDQKIVELLEFVAEYVNSPIAEFAEPLFDVPRAVELLTSVIESFPDNPALYRHRAFAYQAREDFESALADMNRVVELAPAEDHAYIYRANVYTSMNKYEAAITDYGKAIELDPRNDWTWADRAKLYLRMKNYKEAVKHFDEAIILHRLPHFIGHRAEAHFLLNEYDKALDDLNTVLDIEPERANIASWIPASDIAKCPDEQFQKGMQAVANRAVELNPESAVALASRATLSIELGELDRARTDLEKIIELPDAGYYSNYQAALLFWATGHTAEYAKLCQKMVLAFASSDVPLETHFTAWTCALAPAALDDYEPAIELARHAVEKESNNKQFLDGLGAILLRAGKYDDAKEQLVKALETAENDNTSTSYIHYFLAMTEHHLGNADAAKDYLAKANESAEKERANSPAWNRKLTLELLRKEAEALINSEKENN